MNIHHIAFVDRWVGVPLCWALTVVRYVLRALGREPSPAGPPRRICFIKLIEQGSTVLAAGTLRRAVERVGAEYVFFLVFSDNRPILDALEIVPPENVIAVRAGSPWELVAELLRAVRRLRAARIDTAIDLEHFARGTAILAYLSGAARRVGHHRFRNAGGERGDLLTHRVQYSHYLHASQSFALLLDVLDHAQGTPPLSKHPPPPPAPVPRVTPHGDDVASIRALLGAAAIRPDEHDVVVLNPNASDLIPLRKWPLGHYVDLGRRLLAAHPGVRVVATGTPAEAANAEALVRAIDDERAVSLGGRTTLTQLLALYTLTRVLVTNDSGPAQFASLIRLPTVVLFGPETPRLYAPLGEHAVVISAGLACSPCLNVFNHRLSPCRDNVCMQRIGVDEVLAAVDGLLAGARG
jgi:ADP-heptose:LPS heptosyltransferase